MSGGDEQGDGRLLFRCGAVIPGCDAEFSADTEEEILQQVAAHARADHGIEAVDDATAAQVTAAIQRA